MPARRRLARNLLKRSGDRHTIEGTGVSDHTEVNDPDTVAELTGMFEQYEAALMANDVATLNALFWESEFVVRFGPSECLYGHDAIAAYRSGRDVTDISRDLVNTRILTFGTDMGIANTEYVRHASSRWGRQSQTWMRFPDGWKIVSAHVSLLPEA